MIPTRPLFPALTALILLLALLVSPAQAAEPRWQPIGPYGHDGYRLFSTSDPDILYVTTFYSGLYRSDDGGRSWREVNPTNFGALSVDPRDPDVLIGAPGIQEKVVRSVDGGRTFQTYAEGLLYEDQNPQILNFVRDPADPDVVIAATDLGLFRKDGEAPWELVAFGRRGISAFAIDPASPSVWHAAVVGLNPQQPNRMDPLISTDAGATWTVAPAEIDPRFVERMVVDPVRPHRVYAVASCRPIVFDGAAWRYVPLPAGRLACTVEVLASGRVIAPFFDAGTNRSGIMVSDDGGETWTAQGGPRDSLFRIEGIAGDVVVASGGRGLWRSEDGGLTWKASSRGISGFGAKDIAVASDGTVFATPGGEGVFRSRDAGRSWERRVEGLQFDARGFAPLALAVDPRDPAVVWTGGAQLHRSRDAGRTWQGLALPRGPEGRVIDQILIDPTREGVVYVRTYGLIAPGIVGPFVYRTLDDGRTWHPLPRFHRTAWILAVAPSDGKLYAFAEGKLFVSRDTGSSWRPVQQAPPVRVTRLAVDPRFSNVLWLGTDDAGVWRSTDGGKTFTPLRQGEPIFSTIGNLVFDPADPERPYVAVVAQGVYQWRRGGWQKVGTGDPRFEANVGGTLAFDPERRILYAGTHTMGIYKLLAHHPRNEG